jgi:hypothetical protein
MEEDDLFEAEPVGDEEIGTSWLRLMIWWLKTREWLTGG